MTNVVERVAGRAFLLRYSQNEAVAETWGAIWSELFPSDTGGVAQHCTQISADIIEVRCVLFIIIIIIIIIIFLSL